MDRRRIRTPGAAFLISQIGGQSSRLWAARLTQMGLQPREVMLLRHVALREGRSQNDLARAIGLPASRIVGLVNGLEHHGWVERRGSPDDRRANALYLTAKGRDALGRIMAESAAHEADLTRGLAPGQREQLVALLERVAAAQGLIQGVHPGFADPSADQTCGIGDEEGDPVAETAPAGAEPQSPSSATEKARRRMHASFVRFGEIEIDGKTFDRDVVIEAGRVERRHKKPSKAFRDRYGHTPVSPVERIPWSGTTLIVGTGADGALPVMDEVADEARRRGIRLVLVPTPEACDLLSASDPATTSAILHVTC